MELSLGEIAEVTGGHILGERASLTFSHFFHDSREVGKKSFFIALKGEKVDGHDYIKAAYDGGCRGVLISDESKSRVIRDELKDLGFVLVSDAVKALADLGREVLKRMNPTVIGITGSVGKTTTKDMIAKILSTKFKVAASPGNLNTEIGLPIALLNFEDGREIVVLEMATRGFGQIKQLCEIAPPNIAVITNIGHSHLECFGDLDGVRKAKIEIVETMAEGGTAVISGDEERLINEISNLGVRYRTFGESEGLDTVVTGVQISETQTQYKILTGDGSVSGTMDYGTHGDILNCAAAVTVASVLGISASEALESSPEPPHSNLRSEWQPGPNSSSILVDCYNANPESMRNSAQFVSKKRRSGGRVIGVLGDMFELGGSSESEHKNLGLYLAGLQFDELITIGDQMEITMRSFVDAGGVGKHYKSYEQLTEYLINTVREKDVILLKGSRGMTMEKVLNYLPKPS